MSVQLLDVPPAEYHADPWMSLSATIAKSLLLETPAHAKQKHPRLADNYEAKHTDAMDEGTALHQMLLGDDRCDILDYPDFRTAAAKDARDESRSVGRVPLLQKKWDDIAVLGESLKQQVAGFPIDPPLFVDGVAEQTILFGDDQWTGRARPDWLRSDYLFIDDLKKSRSAQTRQFHKTIYSLGYDIQAAFYCRAVKQAFGVEPVFRWVAIEPDPPYAMSVHVLSPAAMKAAHDKVDLAIDIWKECLSSGNWPAYPQTVQVVELPAWMQEQEWDDTAMTEAPF